MNTNTEEIDHVQGIFNELKSDDPTIMFNNDNIELIPCYLNFSFVFNFILIPVFVLALTSEEGKFLGLLGILISLFNVGNFLRLNNKIIIDQRSKTIIIIPNFISKYFIKKFQKVNFKNIKSVAFENDVPSYVFRRYVIVITLSTNQELRILSIGKKHTAEHITNALRGLS